MKKLAAIAVASLVAPLATAQDLLWDLQFGTAAEDFTNAVAGDGVGGLYVAGSTWGDLAGTSAGGTDPWLARYDAAGNEMWSRQFGLGFDVFESADFAAEDGAGGVFVGGGRCDQQCSSTDAWVARYDVSGTEQWNVSTLFASATDAAAAGAPDRSGGVYVGGVTAGSAGGPNMGGLDAWFARLDGSGNRLWIRQFGSAAFDSVAGAASDATGSLFVCGLFGWTGNPVGEGWFGRYDPNGNEQWRVTFATGGYSYAASICTDGEGGLYVCGFTTAPLNGKAPVGGSDAFLARYDGAGNEIWTRVFGVASGDRAHSVALSPSGGVFVTGTERANTAGFFHDDIWLARFDAFGNRLWRRTIATDRDDTLGGIATDGVGGVYMGSTTRGVLGASNAGATDPWIAHFDDVLADRFCSPAVRNSTGVPAVINATGSRSVAANDLRLVASSLPPLSFGFFLVSETQGLAQPPNSQGNLCLGGNIGRLQSQVIQGPTGSIQVDLANVPGNPGSAVVPGDTWSFQCWYRDRNPATTSNLSDAVSVRFL